MDKWVQSQLEIEEAPAKKKKKKNKQNKKTKKKTKNKQTNKKTTHHPESTWRLDKGIHKGQDTKPITILTLLTAHSLCYCTFEFSEFRNWDYWCTAQLHDYDCSYTNFGNWILAQI